MIAFTKATWRALAIHVFIFKGMGRNVMDVGSFTRRKGMRTSFSPSPNWMMLTTGCWSMLIWKCRTFQSVTCNLSCHVALLLLAFEILEFHILDTCFIVWTPNMDFSDRCLLIMPTCMTKDSYLSYELNLLIACEAKGVSIRSLSNKMSGISLSLYAS